MVRRKLLRQRRSLSRRKRRNKRSDESTIRTLQVKKFCRESRSDSNVVSFNSFPESTSTKQEEISQALKRSQELLEKKRERKRLKKQAKLEKAKEEGVEVVKNKKPKDDKENVNLSNKNKRETEQQQPKKKKTLLTAYEVKQQVLQDTDVENGKHDKRTKKKKTKTDQVLVQENVESIPDKENTEHGPPKKQKKKKAKVLEPVRESNHSEESSPPAKKRMLSILNPKGSLNKQGFVVNIVTPEMDRLKRNRGFIEEPGTPKNIGFKVQSMMPTGQEFVKKANKKRKRVEVDIPEPSRLPPKPVWTASGTFEEIDAPESSDFIPLSVNSHSATQFGVSVLGKKNGNETTNAATQGLSSFKMKALYKDKSRMRESSKDLTRKLEKHKLYKGLNA